MKIAVILYFIYPLQKGTTNFSGFFKKLSSRILPGLIFFILMFILSSFASIDLIVGWSWLVLLTGIGVGSVFYGLSPQQIIQASDKVEFSFRRAIGYTGFGLIIGIIFVPIHFFVAPAF